MEQPLTIFPRAQIVATVRQTVPATLPPTPPQERAWEAVLWRCRTRYPTAREQRLTWWRRGHGRHERHPLPAASPTPHRPAGGVPSGRRPPPPRRAGRAGPPRADRAGVLPSGAGGRNARLSARLPGRGRSHSCSCQASGTGAHRAPGYLVLAQLGRVAVRGSRPGAGTPQRVTRSHEADGWEGAGSCGEGPPAARPPTGRETGSDGGRTGVLLTAPGAALATPRPSRRAPPRRATAPPRLARRQTRRAAGGVGSRRAWCSPRPTSRCGGTATTARTRPPGPWGAPTTPARATTCGSPLCYAPAPAPRAAPRRAGQRCVPPVPSRPRAPGRPCWWETPPVPARRAGAAQRAGTSAARSGPTSALPVGWYSTATSTRPRPSCGPGRPVGER